MFVVYYYLRLGRDEAVSLTKISVNIFQHVVKFESSSTHLKILKTLYYLG